MRRVGIVLFERFELLDVCGPAEMLGGLPDHFTLRTVAARPGPVASNQFLSIVAQDALDERTHFDVLLVPGGQGTRSEVDNEQLVASIAAASRAAEMTLSICTGAALLARGGVLDGLRATTNKRSFDWVRSQGPQVNWVPQARWVEDGTILTSAGVSAGMDAALRAIERLVGTDAAEEAAKRTEYDWHRDPTWDPFAALYGLKG